MSTFHLDLTWYTHPLLSALFMLIISVLPPPEKSFFQALKIHKDTLNLRNLSQLKCSGN